MAEPIHDKDRALLRNFLCDRDAHCPLCQYNLRNCTVAECPECGKAIRLAVVSPDLSVAAWGFLTFILALPAGVGGIFLVMLLSQGWPSRQSGENITVACFIAALPLALAALLLRRRFLKLSKDSQHMLAVAGTIGTILLFVMFFVNMFG